MLGMTQSYKRRTLIICSETSRGYEAVRKMSRRRKIGRSTYQVRDNDLRSGNLARGSSGNTLVGLGGGGGVGSDRGVRLLSGDSGRPLANTANDGRNSRLASATTGTTRASGEDLVERAVKVGSHY